MYGVNYVEEKSEEKGRLESNEIIEESRRIRSAAFAQRLSFKINILGLLLKCKNSPMSVLIS